MGYVEFAGHLLDDGETRLAAAALDLVADVLEQRNGTVPAAVLQLRDQLATSAASARRNRTPQASAGCGTADDGAAVIVAASAPEMTTAQAAAELRVSARWVRGLCHSGDLTATLSPAGQWRINAGSVAALAARRTEET